jgi:hypothetical protein
MDTEYTLGELPDWPEPDDEPAPAPLPAPTPPLEGTGWEAAPKKGRALKAPVRAKYLSPSWVDEGLKGLEVDSLYEPFAGRGRLAHYFKRKGLRVAAGDLLESHHCFQRALIENNGVTVGHAQALEWLAIIKDPYVATRFSAWAPGYFTPEEAIWLGIWNAHLSAPGLDPVVRALGASAVGMTMSYWLSFNRHGRFQKPMAPATAFQHYLQTINSWVCNNGQTNQALWGDAYSLAPKVEADVMVCYPPTDQGFFDYPEPQYLFDCWVKGDPAMALPGLKEVPGVAPTLGVPLSDPSAYAEALRRFLDRAKHFPIWVLAFHDRYPIEEAEFTAIVKEHRPVSRRLALAVATGEKGHPPGERLIVAQSR